MRTRFVLVALLPALAHAQPEPDSQVTFDYMPNDFVTFRFELNYRRANIPYFSGTGGVTPPGGNMGNPGSVVGVDNDGVEDWSPDLEKDEPRFTAALLVKI
jgi:hypothetical protein